MKKSSYSKILFVSYCIMTSSSKGYLFHANSLQSSFEVITNKIAIPSKKKNNIITNRLVQSDYDITLYVLTSILTKSTIQRTINKKTYCRLKLKEIFFTIFFAWQISVSLCSTIRKTQTVETTIVTLSHK